MSKQTTLHHPDGRTWTPEDAVQANNLRSAGWSEKAPAKADEKPATTKNTTK